MSRKVAFYGIFAALGILMGYVEYIIPSPVPVPGIKLGLANVIVLIAMYFIGNKAALSVSAVRVLISSLLFGGFSGFLYSIAGALVSFFVMASVKKIKSAGIIGVSIMGGVSHNIAQIAVAALVLQTTGLVYYIPALLVSGVITGIVIGIVAKHSLAHIEKAGIKF
ncbi:hypothetical protein SDC9_64731 [bioreactor metagenome]|uniref:Heptaprenyl diphosphate synthase component I n=1 Tax=bioreactor metagenome TaxID=1076179 RepID=A0A644XVI7_9ZZZZ|nr:Gx transporter family protein [Candidatus Metalachnospira sp.]